ncbi:MAG: RHS repeat domain-containing protein [Terriglobia bacterium]
MTCTPSNGQCATLSYNTSTNRITSSGYTYDAAGNLTADGTGNTYAWNAEGRLTGTSAWSGAVYNALEERTERIPIQGDTADYLYDPWGEDIGHYDATQGYWYDEYIPFGGRTLADYKASAPPQTVTQFSHPNALGSRSMATDALGNYVEETQYNPLGQNWQSTGAVWDQRFGGMPIFDADVGLDATAFRMYAPLQGRWLTPDPADGDLANPQSLNRYAYALNNPETLTDPLGLQSGCPQRAEQIGICRGGVWYPPGGAVILEPRVSGNVGGIDEFDLLAFAFAAANQGTYYYPCPYGDCGYKTQPIFVPTYSPADIADLLNVSMVLPGGITYQPGGGLNSAPSKNYPAPLPDWGNRPPDQQACYQQALQQDVGPGAGVGEFLSAFSLYNVKGNFAITAGAETARWGLWGLGIALGKPTLEAAGEGVAIASGVATAAATIMDARARYDCGEPLAP